MEEVNNQLYKIIFVNNRLLIILVNNKCELIKKATFPRQPFIISNNTSLTHLQSFINFYNNKLIQNTSSLAQYKYAIDYSPIGLIGAQLINKTGDLFITELYLFEISYWNKTIKLINKYPDEIKTKALNYANINHYLIGCNLYNYITHRHIKSIMKPIDINRINDLQTLFINLLSKLKLDKDLYIDKFF